MPKISIARSSSNKWVFGVCAGLGKYFGINPMWIRLVALGFAILPAGLGIPPMIAIYLIMTMLMPKDTDAPLSDM